MKSCHICVKNRNLATIRANRYYSAFLKLKKKLELFDGNVLHSRDYLLMMMAKARMEECLKQAGLTLSELKKISTEVQR